MATQKNLSRKKKKKFQASLIYRETLFQKRCVCVCVCVGGEGFPHISCAFCPAPPDLDPLFPYNNKGAFLSSHYPTITTALLRSSFNTRKYQQCVEILCFNELLKWKCCYKNIQWEEEVSPLFTSFPQKTKKRFQCSVEGLRMRSLGHLAGADEKGL